MKYRPEIDGLRAIAVCAVILNHSGAPLTGGFLGVDIFFVISGFLITTILARELSDGQFSITRFYERRARRILPALVVVTVSCIPAAWVLMSPEQMKLFSQSLVALTLFATNFLYWVTSGYFAPSSEENPMLHTWSLAVEEQFYIIFPILLMILWQMRRSVLFSVLSLLALLSLISAESVARLAPSLAFYMLPFRAWELLAGGLTGLILLQNSVKTYRLGLALRRGPLPSGLALLGLALIILSICVFSPSIAIPGLWFVIPIGGTVLVLMFASKSNFTGRILSATPLVWIGLISYSAYLWHQPVLAFARIAQTDHLSLGFIVFLICLTFLLAWLTWWAVEQPFRKKVPLRQLVSGGILAAAVAGSVGIIGHLTNGYKSERFSGKRLALFESMSISPKRMLCHGSADQLPAPEDACIYLADTTPSWAVLGDSHAVEVSYALAEALRPLGESLIHFSASSCPPAYLFNTDVGGCREWTNRTVDWLTKQPNIKTVVISYRHASYLFGQNEVAEPLPDTPYRISGLDSPEEKRAMYWISFDTIVKKLKESGKRVVLVEPFPEIRRSIEHYIMHPDVQPNGLVTINRKYYDARNSTIFKHLRSLDVEIMSTGNILCDDSLCYGGQDSTSFYFDDDHLSLAGARLIVDHFMRTSGTIDANGIDNEYMFNDKSADTKN